MDTVGRTWTTASKLMAPPSSPEVMSISGDAIGSISESIDGTGVEVREGLAECFRPQCSGSTHTRLEHLAWHLAGTETRYSDLRSQGLDDVNQSFVKLWFVDLDAQTDEVSLQRFSGGTHHELHTLLGESRHAAQGPSPAWPSVSIPPFGKPPH